MRLRRLSLSIRPNAHAYIIMGRAYMRAGDSAKAAEALSRAAQLQPGIETYYTLAICWLSIKTSGGK